MSDVTARVEAVEEVRPVELSADVLDDRLIGQLVDRARASGLQLTGEGGLLQQLSAPAGPSRENSGAASSWTRPRNCWARSRSTRSASVS